jgi:hypothetical protein
MVQHLLCFNSITVILQKRKHSALEAGTSLSKKRHDGHITTHEEISKLGTPKEERVVLSHSPQSEQKQKVIIKARQTRRAIKGKLFVHIHLLLTM